VPLFDHETFKALYERQDSPNPTTDAAWYASLNVVLAIGSMMSEQDDGLSQTGPAVGEDDKHSGWRYLRNSCSVFTDLLFASRSLMAVQALLGIVRSDPHFIVYIK
jgi:hypothetical protein